MRTLPSLLAIGICAVSFAVVIYWGGQDKQGQFRSEILLANPAMFLFFTGPYVVLTVATLIGWQYRPSAIACFWVTLLLSLLAVWAVWSDHDTSQRTPPGREVAPMLGFLATIVLWLGSATLLIGVWTKRIISRKQSAAAPDETNGG